MCTLNNNNCMVRFILIHLSVGTSKFGPQYYIVRSLNAIFSNFVRQAHSIWFSRHISRYYVRPRSGRLRYDWFFLCHYRIECVLHNSMHLNFLTWPIPVYTVEFPTSNRLIKIKVSTGEESHTSLVGFEDFQTFDIVITRRKKPHFV